MKSMILAALAAIGLMVCTASAQLSYPKYIDTTDEAMKTKFDTWATRHGSRDENGIYAKQFLMNIAPTATPTLTITSIKLIDGGAKLMIDGGSVNLADINGALFVRSANKLDGLGKGSFTTAGFSFSDGDATVTIKKAHTFFKAYIDFAAPTNPNVIYGYYTHLNSDPDGPAPSTFYGNNLPADEIARGIDEGVITTDDYRLSISTSSIPMSSTGIDANGYDVSTMFVLVKQSTGYKAEANHGSYFGTFTGMNTAFDRFALDGDSSKTIMINGEVYDVYSFFLLYGSKAYVQVINTK